MTTIGLIQARMTSTRLPGKVLIPIAGHVLLARVVAAAKACRDIDKVVVATGDNGENDPIAHWCAEHDITFYRGSETDVLDRFASAAATYEADLVVRLTADCPFLDPALIAQVIAVAREADLDYASNVSPARWPDGLDCEVIRASALHQAASEAIRASDREHVTPFIRNNRARFQAANVDCPVSGLERLRWTVDTDTDVAHAERLLAALVAEGHDPRGPFAWTDILRVERGLEDDASSSDGPRGMGRETRNEGFLASLAAEQASGNCQPISFERSVAFLERAERTVPLGSQTFSKSRVQFPVGASPSFLSAGSGGRVWDLDGNEYVDMVNGLLCVLLGYCDPDVDRAVRAQLDRGISFSMATELEAQLAEMMVSMIPCAEKVRFGKNGSDATSAAIRIARAATGRPQVIVLGYHGWHDWYIGTTTRSKGVPEPVAGLSHKAPYNDLDAVKAIFEAHPGEIACLIMEPANIEPPKDGYLQALKALCHANGAILVFDEIITGFRFSRGGAQELFGATPDLACFGKGMANGMPISAIVGRADLMAEFEDIFVSGTFGGEALSLAAAIATLEKIEREPVLQTIEENGAALASAVTRSIEDAGLSAVLSLKGFAPWKLLQITDHQTADMWAIKTLFITEMARRGVLTLGSHNMSYAQTDTDLAQVVSAYDEVLPLLADKLSRGSLVAELETQPLEPVFRIR